MENLQYIVDDNTIVELLGLQSFTSKESAILELVKNAYDAGAKNLSISIKPHLINITDDGCGMNKSEFKENWLHIGKSNKGYDFKDKKGNLRISAGEKGIGRFALARLGAFVEMYSKKENDDSVYWKTNWSDINYIDTTNYLFPGTCFIINETRENWSYTQAKNLISYLERTYIDSYMKITVFFEDEEIKPSIDSNKLEIGINYSEYIRLVYSSDKCELLCEITNDEFQESAKKFYQLDDITKHVAAFNLVNEFLNEYISDNSEKSNEFDEERAKNELTNLLKKIGNFSADLYFGIGKVLKGDDEKFLYKHKSLSGLKEKGIILYRNSFSISSYEGIKDWLELGKRARKSPASPTHESGNWRVRENQIFGKVVIDKKENKELKDLANRQGLVENEYYKYFIKTLHLGISEFERYRQEIIRAINIKNKPNPAYKEERISDSLIEKPSILSTLDDHQKDKLISEIKQYKEQEENFDNITKDYKSDVRILNTLATNGLHASSLAHELDNKRDALITTSDNIIYALKNYKMWDQLQSNECTKIGNRNIPRLLNKNKEINYKICNFIDTILNSIEKDQYELSDLNIKQVLRKISEKWEKEVSNIKINFMVSDDLLFHCSEDIFTTIFDNLILNSYQQNIHKQLLIINISITSYEKKLEINYSDDGEGLPNKFINNPKRILEAMETSRPNGHGLGMWIVNNTLHITGGEVIDIQTPPGFKIIFTIGDEL